MRRSPAVRFLALAWMAVLCAIPAPRAVAGPPPDRFAAIALSLETGRYGYSTGAASLAAAAAVARSKTGDPNAEILVWVQNGWVALAFSDNGTYAATWSTRSARDAAASALRDCAVNGGRSQLAVCTSAH
jgi:hypothetical protein